jgi:transposase
MKGYGKQIFKKIREFSIFTDSIQAIETWLRAHGVNVAIESTGVYWKPVFNILANEFDLMLINARHVKNVPDHKLTSRIAKVIQVTKSRLLERNLIIDNHQSHHRSRQAKTC